ncbi:ZNF442 isoform 1, partial [Pan troglodytes]
MKWEDTNIEDQHKNPRRSLRCHIIERFSESRQPDSTVNEKTPGVDPCKSSVCGEIMGCSFLNCYITFDAGHKPDECQEYGEKPHTHKQCGTAFNYHHSFQTQERPHTGNKRYDCKECGKTFSSSGNLRRHIIVQRGGGPYICKLCRKAFFWPSL